MIRRTTVTGPDNAVTHVRDGEHLDGAMAGFRA